MRGHGTRVLAIVRPPKMLKQIEKFLLNSV
jgi:hypothetical protein